VDHPHTSAPGEPEADSRLVYFLSHVFHLRSLKIPVTVAMAESARAAGGYHALRRALESLPALSELHLCRLGSGYERDLGEALQVNKFNISVLTIEYLHPPVYPQAGAPFSISHYFCASLREIRIENHGDVLPYPQDLYPVLHTLVLHNVASFGGGLPLREKFPVL
jgi:hypothetical protein